MGILDRIRKKKTEETPKQIRPGSKEYHKEMKEKSVELGFRDWEQWEVRCDKDTPFPNATERQTIHPIRFLVLGETVSINAENVLDCACGPGIDYTFFRNTSTKYIGIDNTPRFVKKAKRDYPGIDIQVMDVMDIKFDDESIDVVYCKDLLEHMHPDHAQAAVKEMWRVTKKRMMIVFFRVPSDEPTEVRRTQMGEGYFFNKYNKQVMIKLIESLPNFEYLRIIENVGDNHSALYVIDKVPFKYLKW